MLNLSMCSLLLNQIKSIPYIRSNDLITPFQRNRKVVQSTMAAIDANTKLAIDAAVVTVTAPLLERIQALQDRLAKQDDEIRAPEREAAAAQTGKVATVNGTLTMSRKTLSDFKGDVLIDWPSLRAILTKSGCRTLWQLFADITNSIPQCASIPSHLLAEASAEVRDRASRTLDSTHRIHSMLRCTLNIMTELERVVHANGRARDDDHVTCLKPECDVSYPCDDCIADANDFENYYLAAGERFGDEHKLGSAVASEVMHALDLARQGSLYYARSFITRPKSWQWCRANSRLQALGPSTSPR